MNKVIRALAVGAGAVATIGVLAACSSTAEGPSTDANETAAAAMPSSATFIADMTGEDGQTMTMAIAVEAEKVVAYTTNGTDNEARFAGTQEGGRMELMSPYGDTLIAAFDGEAITGEVTMNVAPAEPVKFSAVSASAPAGLYTAVDGNSRAAWVVRPDRTMVGMVNLDTRGHTTVADAKRANDRMFMDQVRQMRLNRQLQPAPQMDSDTMSLDMNGQRMSATRLSPGDSSF